jgi:non-heme chloroperoxidase
MKMRVGKENSTSINLYYEDHGKGQPVVLIHGFPLSGSAWEKEKMALVNAGYRTITYDRRGFGDSSKPAKGYDYDTFASDLDKLMTELDLHDVCLVGHSMGTGEVGRYISTYGSERVSGAVFISPLEPFLLKTDDNPQGVDEKVFTGFKQAIMDDRLAYLTTFFQDFYNLDVTLGKSVSKEVVQYNWNVAAGASPIGTLNCVSAWVTDFRKDIPRIDVPSLIIQGDADRILPLSVTGERFHKQLKGSKLVVLKDAPHGIPWTHAADINRELLTFLNQISAGKSMSFASSAPH